MSATSAAARPGRSWLIWTASFLSFPLAGVASGAIAGRLDSTVAALMAGVVTGLIIGAGQAMASSGRLEPRRWIPATTVGMGAGLALGATVAGFGTSLRELAMMGAVTGLALGPAQALALPAAAVHRWLWAIAMPALWALGWTVTTLAGIDVDRQFSVFGSTGALTVSALAGGLLHLVAPLPSPTAPSTLIGDLS